jgi:pimeloyl-ACP methyl ester carboxylesterase
MFLQYTVSMSAFRAIFASVVLAGLVAAQTPVSFPAQDGGIVYADLYGSGVRTVVLAHGGRCPVPVCGFTKASWAPQARALSEAGFRVLAIDLRVYAPPHDGAELKQDDGGLRFDVLAAVRYLRRKGAKTVSIVGASMGGDAAAEALEEAKPGEIDRLVLLAAGTYGHSEKWKARTLFIVARDDADEVGLRLPRIRAQYEKAPGPKELVVLEGSAHAQDLFNTDQGERLMRAILRFLSAP